jgi:hypothetical protein
MARRSWQEYFEQFIRASLQNLAASQASGRELIERLHEKVRARGCGQVVAST